MIRLHEIEIPDKDGVLHRYEHAPFGFDDSFDLGLELADIVGGPLGKAFGSLISGGHLDTELAELPLGEVFGAGFEAPRRILEAGGAKILDRILRTTKRAFVDREGKTKLQPLGNPEARTAAYSGGNMMECFKAVRWILEVNYGPFLTDLWGQFSERLSAFMPPGPVPAISGS